MCSIRSKPLRNRKVLVLGEAMLDSSYLQGTTERLCPQVPVVDTRESIHVPGGAANTAVNLHSLGARVVFLSVIGQDEAGSKLLTALKNHQVATDLLLRVPGRDTLAKQRILAGSLIVVRFDQGTKRPIDLDVETRLIGRLKVIFKEYEALVISDYDYGIVTPRVLVGVNTTHKTDWYLPRDLLSPPKGCSKWII